MGTGRRVPTPAPSRSTSSILRPGIVGVPGVGPQQGGTIAADGGRLQCAQSGPNGYGFQQFW
jgi:hypothetical protein